MSYISGVEILARVAADPAHIDALRDIPTSVLGDVMGARLKGTTALRPINRSAIQVCGNAFTVRVRSGDNLLIHKALQMLAPGDVLVIDGEGDTSRALVGEIMMTTARMKGAIAFVIDGAIRDADAFETHRFPCWARGISLRGPYKDGPGSINVPISIAGLQVAPGDILVGDSDGVIAVPAKLALEVAALGKKKVEQEQDSIAQILAGTYSSAWVDAALNQKYK